jgi:hypothetical protein
LRFQGNRLIQSYSKSLMTGSRDNYGTKGEKKAGRKEKA